MSDQAGRLGDAQGEEGMIEIGPRLAAVLSALIASALFITFLLVLARRK